MEQKNYILREVEKLGLLLQVIINESTGNRLGVDVTVYDKIAEAKNNLRSETDFDKLISLKNSEIEEYINSFDGFSYQNIELVGDILKIIGTNIYTQLSELLLEKALQLYERCNTIDSTFSFEREREIGEIRQLQIL